MSRYPDEAIRRFDQQFRESPEERKTRLGRIKHTFWIYPARPVAREERSALMTPEPDIKELHAVLDPLFFKRNWEHVTVLFEGRRADMFVDERGRLDDLPRNDAATAIYRAGWLARFPESNPEDLHWIAGTAVLFERVVWT
jgi:hypothetical protein